MRLLLVMLLGTPTLSFALCLNPFGCEPETEAECIKAAGSAKTEAAAKAMIQECRRTSWVTLPQCTSAEKQWATYVAASKGAEWEWPGRDIKAECRGKFPTTFSPRLWVDETYCKSNARRLAEASSGVDPVSRKSRRLEQVRRDLPELSGLDDRHAIELLQTIYYKEKSSAEIAAAVYLDAPENPLGIVELCKGLSSPAATK